MAHITKTGLTSNSQILLIALIFFKMYFALYSLL